MSLLIYKYFVKNKKYKKNQDVFFSDYIRSREILVKISDTLIQFKIFLEKIKYFLKLI